MNKYGQWVHRIIDQSYDKYVIDQYYTYCNCVNQCNCVMQQ